MLCVCGWSTILVLVDPWQVVFHMKIIKYQIRFAICIHRYTFWKNVVIFLISASCSWPRLELNLHDASAAQPRNGGLECPSLGTYLVGLRTITKVQSLRRFPPLHVGRKNRNDGRKVARRHYFWKGSFCACADFHHHTSSPLLYHHRIPRPLKSPVRRISTSWNPEVIIWRWGSFCSNSLCARDIDFRHTCSLCGLSLV